MIGELRNHLSKNKDLSKTSKLCNSSVKRSRKRFILPNALPKAINYGGILNTEPSDKRLSTMASRDKGTKEFYSNTKSKVESVIERNPNFIKNLIKSKATGLGLKLKVKEIGKSRKVSPSPSQDNEKTTFNCESYIPTESNCASNSKPNSNACLSLKSRNLTRNLTHCETQYSQADSKKLINIKSMIPIKDQAFRTEAIKLKTSKVNKLGSQIALEIKPTEGLRLKAKIPPHVSLSSKSKDKTRFVTDNLKKQTAKAEINSNAVLSKVKNCLGYDFQGLFNFSYDEFHNLTSNRLSSCQESV